MSGHTPGKWKVEYKPGYRHFVHGVDNNAICKMADSRPTDETQANSRLIAAAPELLEACKKALSVGEAGNHIDCETFVMLRNAIAKVEKRQ